MKVLMIDIGGSHVKLRASERDRTEQFDSGPDMTPQDLVRQVHRLTADWDYEVITIGYPGRVKDARPLAEPGNLGDGWVGFDFENAFGKPVRFIHDGALQALGGYNGGRMLFLGLGTGLGSALIIDRVVIPLELGGITHTSGEMLWKRVGKQGLKDRGKETWYREVTEAVDMLREAMAADYVLLGGGNAELIDPLPPKCRRGGNEDAFTGGVRLWEEFVEPHDRKPPSNWRVL